MTKIFLTAAYVVILLLATASICTTAQAAGWLTTTTVELEGGPSLVPWVFSPINSRGGPLAAVLVVPDWYGRNDFAIAKARELAELGYGAIAWDMYGDAKVTTSPAEAGRLAGALKNDRAEMRRRIQAGVKFARALPGVDPDRIAVIGFCFGGTTVLELARSGSIVRGVVSFHGGLDRSKEVAISPVQTRVLVLHGADDPLVPAADVKALKKEMHDAGAVMKFVSYPGAVHSFTNPAAGDDPSKGAAYNAEADRKSREEMKAFLADVLK
ncbi:dienelactone hydrolase [candidate division BRC1 bacterium HGW-BRC1-1]|jgi:dienelactone hydrolase|nr:MAG: dienelactone hydrolase [candidate division BRC1 bacterium HGW-BRC1-1]